VTHEEIRVQLDAYLDGELAPHDARQLEAHVNACPDCAALRDARIALSAAIRREIPPFRAPAELRDTIHDQLRNSAGLGHSRRPRVAQPVWRWAALAASVVLVALGSWQLGLRRGSEAAVGDEILASHIRSLMPGHLTDVVSSDQHTVKPWFNGKLDFSPPVYDFAGRGYPLVGGRLDYVAGRAVAALVYQRRKHLINVFLWPRGNGPLGERTPLTDHGYHLLHWSSPAYEYWVASDLGTTELTEFAGLLRQGESAAAPTGYSR
jgi:anti-sigma factor (TIGR02949 family)